MAYINNLMKVFSFLIIFLLPIISFTQLIDNSRAFVFNDDPFFNTLFIKNNKIKSIHGIISTKKELSAIKKTNLVFHFDFNEKGELIKQYNSVKGITKLILPSPCISIQILVILLLKEPMMHMVFILIIMSMIKMLFSLKKLIAEMKMQVGIDIILN